MAPVVRDLLRCAVELGLTPGEVKGSSDVRDVLAGAAGLGDARVRAEQWRQVLPQLLEAHEAAARKAGGSRCRVCSAPIVWGQTEAGKAMSLDPLPRPDGNVIRIAQGKRMVLRVVPKSALPVVGRPAYFAHFVTCPYSDQFRRRNRKPGQPGDKRSRCVRCGRPMDPYLPGAGYSTHPGCDPNEEPKEQR